MPWSLVKNGKPKHTKYSRVLVGGIVGTLVSSLVHPLDLVKVRMQLHPSKCTAMSVARSIVRCEGYLALYNGVTAGIMRQATYTTTRLGVYYWMTENYITKYGKIPGISEKVVIGLYAGLAGGFAGNPAEVVLVRMMADGRSDPCSLVEYPRKKTYRGVFHAWYKISKDEGVRALWRGGTLTIFRSFTLSFVQIGGYLKTRDYLRDSLWPSKDEESQLHVSAAMISSFLTAVLTLPLDVLKTKYQVRTDKLTQKELFFNIYKVNGLKYFWQGFIPYHIRLFTHTTLAYFILIEVGDIYATIRNFLKDFSENDK